MNPFLRLFDLLINLYMWIVISQVVLSLLISFAVVNARQPFVQAVGEFLYRATEPVLAPIRRRMPNFGQVDLSPAVLLIGLQFISWTVHWIF